MEACIVCGSEGSKQVSISTQSHSVKTLIFSGAIHTNNAYNVNAKILASVTTLGKEFHKLTARTIKETSLSKATLS